MKKKITMKAGCAFLCVTMLSGCSSLKKLDNPYDFAQRTALYEGTALSDRAESFAHNLCVVTADTPSTDQAVTAEAAAVFDLSDKTVIFGKNPFEKLYRGNGTGGSGDYGERCDLMRHQTGR